MSIALSLRDDRLAHASPLWVMRLAQAVTLLCFVSVAGWLLEFILVLPHLISTDSLPDYIIRRLLEFLLPLEWLAVWLLATPEYVALGGYRNRRWCFAIRIAATFTLLRHLTFFSFLRVPTLNFGLSFAPPCSIVLSWLYLRHLARRLPDRALYMHAPFVMAACALGDLLGHTVTYARDAFGLPLPVMSNQVYRLQYLVVVGYTIFILARFSNRFTEATNQAMKNQLSEEAPSE